MLILDLFCGGGGAAEGYLRAFPGATVLGVDIYDHSENYPGTFVELDALASLMGLSLAAAVALPTAVTVAASKVGMSESEFLFRLHNNDRLRAYVAEVCRKVVA